MQIFTVVGARPQFIKASIVSQKLARISGITETIVHTGQHYDPNMSDVFFKELGIPAPGHFLGISGGGHGSMTGRMMAALEDLLLARRPDIVLVYGDTNSTLAGSLAAAKLNIPIAHVEAGLRSFNRQMPEEINRVLTDHCSHFLFTPTSIATENLLREGIPSALVFQTGDVMLDACLHFATLAAQSGAGAPRLGLKKGSYVLSTIHRQENTDDIQRLEAIIDGLSLVAAEMTVVLPLHPRTRAKLESARLRERLQTLRIIDPLGYLDMVGLEMHAAVIATDSGGIQKEAFFHGVPCVTLRNETEWVELVEGNWNRLVPPTDAVEIRNAIFAAKGTVGDNISPYGIGLASQKIADVLLGKR